jgi:hypothetical protein
MKDSMGTSNEGLNGIFPSLRLGIFLGKFNN